jgi:hypothetical protein
METRADAGAVGKRAGTPHTKAREVAAMRAPNSGVADDTNASIFAKTEGPLMREEMRQHGTAMNRRFLTILDGGRVIEESTLIKLGVQT